MDGDLWVYLLPTKKYAQVFEIKRSKNTDYLSSVSSKRNYKSTMRRRKESVCSVVLHCRPSAEGGG